MDEMHIKEDLVYNKHSGELVGFVNLGDINTHLLKYEQSFSGEDPQTEPLAKSMFTIMVRGLFNRLQFPYAQFPCKSISGDLLCNPFWEAVSRIERLVYSIVDCYAIIIGYLFFDSNYGCGLKVMGVTCDGNSANRRFYKLHSKEKEEVYKVKNPSTSEGRPVFFLSDPPHLIKTTRNCWASLKRNLWACIIYKYEV